MLISSSIKTEASMATFIVAANNASANKKAIADYVCDGSADDVEIQAAIDALSANGGRVFCTEGDYVFAGSIDVESSHIVLEFSKGSTVKIVNTGHSLSSFTKHTDKFFYLIRAANIDDFTIRGTRMDWEAGAGQSKFDVNENYTSIWLDECNEAFVEDCIVKNVVRNISSPKQCVGIMLSSCTDSIVRRSAGDNTGYEGIGIRGNCRNVIVEECRAKDNYAHSAQASGWGPTHYGYPVRVSFLSNIFSGNLCIHCHPEDSGGDCLIARNIADSIHVYGQNSGTIVVDNVTKMTIINNEGSGGVSGVMENILIANNSLDFDTGDSTSVVQVNSYAGTGGIIKNIRITGNILHNRRIQIKTLSGASNNIEDVVIEGNVLHCENGTTMYPILLYIDGDGTIDRVRISNNQIRSESPTSNDVHGMKFIIAGDGDINHLQICSNLFKVKMQNIYFDKSSGTGTMSYIFIEDNTFDCAQNLLFTQDNNFVDHVYFRNNNVITSRRILYGPFDNVWVEKNTIITFTDTLYAGGPTNLTVKENKGYVTENCGNSSGTGAEQTIAHGLSAIPTIAILSGDSSNVNGYQSSPADGTNIYITADNGESYHWEAKVR